MPKKAAKEEKGAKGKMSKKEMFMQMLEKKKNSGKGKGKKK